MIRERVEKLQVHLFKWLISNLSLCFGNCILLKRAGTASALKNSSYDSHMLRVSKSQGGLV